MSKYKSSRIQKGLPQYLAEMFLILISVLLAFFLNEVRNNHVENKKLTTSLKFIQKEIIQNQTLIEEHIIMHNIIINNIDSLLDNGLYHEVYSPTEGFNYYHIFPTSFFKQILSNEAWEIAVNNNIFNKIDIEDIVILSRAYDQQKSVTNEVIEISEYLLSDKVYNEKLIKTNCQILKKRFMNLRGVEERLAYNYNAALEVLSKLNK